MDLGTLQEGGGLSKGTGQATQLLFKAPGLLTSTHIPAGDFSFLGLIYNTLRFNI